MGEPVALRVPRLQASLGVACGAVGAFSAIRFTMREQPGLVWLAAVGSALGAIALWRVLTMSVSADSGGLTIRNLMNTRSPRWDDVASVRVGWGPALPMVAWGKGVIVDLVDGSSIRLGVTYMSGVVNLRHRSLDAEAAAITAWLDQAR